LLVGRVWSHPRDHRAVVLLELLGALDGRVPGSYELALIAGCASNLGPVAGELVVDRDRIKGLVVLNLICTNWLQEVA